MNPTELQKALAHQEAVELTLAWVKEMSARVPALRAALSQGYTHGISPAEDVKQFEAALRCLHYFTPSEGAFYKPTAAELKAKLAEAPKPTGSKPSKPSWRAEAD
jgi:hypothetical protein